ncbi:MAG: NYN domain-containing protein [Selenomonadaceae bacterium]|nr:NYN domain-containing protein [Selenomonadaceae bacterium]
MIAHIFIDAENVKPEIAFKAVEKFSYDYEVGTVDIIGKQEVLSPKYLDASKNYRIQNCDYGKNSADTWLCTEIAKTIFEQPAVEVIVLVSSDRDFMPAIKLATEQNRKVIVVSNGLGHKGLKAMLYDLRINPDLIELVDFRTGLTIPKRGSDEVMENAQPSGHLEKLFKLCANLPPNTKNFYLKRASKVKFIFVKNGNRLAEIPFVNGINVSTFTNTLLDFKIIGRDDSAAEVIAESFLKLVNKSVYLYTEDELSQLDDTGKDPATNFLNEHAAEVKTVFVKCGDKIHEVPFVDGIPAEIFALILKKSGVTGDIKSVVAESFLDSRGGKIYFRDAAEVMSYVEPALNNLSADTKKFLQENKSAVEFIPITSNKVTYKVPFIDGMHLSVFVRILHELKVIGKNAPTAKILKANGLKIQDNIVSKS